MADKYGSYYNNGSYNVYRAAIRYETTSTSDTSVTIRCRSWCQMGQGHDSGANIQGRAYITDSYSSWVSGSGYLNAGDESGWLGDITKTITKTEKAQTITCSGQVRGSTWGNATSPWVNATITVPALQSWSVTYNANSGSGAPDAQTKFFGKTLTLSSTIPTRSGYTFAGWATSQANANAGTVAYKAGASYTGNAALTLYAVWKANANAPTISRLVAYRSTSGTRDDASTEQVTFECTWTMDSGAATRSLVFKYRIDGGTEVSKTISSPAVSGSTKQSYTVTLAAGSRMSVTATATDGTHSLTATKTTAIGPVFKPFHMANKGRAAAFFGVAESTWNKVLRVVGTIQAMDESISSAVTPSSSKWGQGMYVCDSEGEDVAYTRLIKLTNGNQGLQLEARRVISGTSKYNTLNMLLDTSGNPVIDVGVPKVWHKEISSWTSIATTSGETAKTFSDVNTAGYSELLVVAKSGTKYRSSVVIPVAELDTTLRDWYLGGGTWSTHWGASCAMTRTQIKPYKIQLGSETTNADWTVYAR